MNVILGLILAFLVYLMANGLYKLMNRPKVVKINRDERPGTALLVIDMQEDFIRSEGKMALDAERRDAAISTINEATAKAHEAGIPIIEVSHVFTDPLVKTVVKLINKGRGNEGSEGLQRDRDLTFNANHHIWKHEGDSFSVPMLARFLDDHQIGHLLLTGQEATACVNATAKGALARSYDVTLLDDGILARKPEKWTALADKLVAQGATKMTNADYWDQAS